MEPFLSRDGKYLFFNNLNEPKVNTNLHWAERDRRPALQISRRDSGVNTPDLEGVPSMDRDGNFYFVSNRSYSQTASTLYRGKFADGAISGVELVPGVSLAKPGIVNFDAEISADGNTLYFVESQFSIFGHPKSARILFARRSGNTFVRDPAAHPILKTIDTRCVELCARYLSFGMRDLLYARWGAGAGDLHGKARGQDAAVSGAAAAFRDHRIRRGANPVAR